MASLSNLVCLISLCASLVLINPLGCNGQYFFIFGDSLYDPGNNQYITPDEQIPAYSPPYGTTFFNHSTGRFSDGRVVADFIAVKLNLSFIPPILQPNADFSNGASFASGGAGVFDTNPKALSLGKQLEKFKEVAANWTEKLGQEEATSRLQSAVYLVCMGGNDYFSYTFNYPNATASERQEFVDSVVGNITDVIKEIYEIGGRKFAFQSVAPIGCLPMMKQNFEVSGDGCAGKPLVLARLHNVGVSKANQLLQTELPGYTYTIFDYHTAIGDRIYNPTAYGFKVGDVACCGVGTHRASDCGSLTASYELCYDPNDYVFFDGGHNTDRANHQLAELMWRGGQDVVAPHNLEGLFSLDPTAGISSNHKKTKLRMPS